MAKQPEYPLLIALDIGTAEVKAVAAEVLDDGRLNILGIGRKPSRGMDRGTINDLNSVVESVAKAINEMELMANCQASSVLLSVSGPHVKCQNERGMYPINQQEVTDEDIDNVIHAARSVPIATERKILHVLPQEYKIDTQENIKNPLGMTGVRMEAAVHMITCADDMARNLTKCIGHCDLVAEQVVFSGVASSLSVLTEDEKELGVAVLDIGAGTIELVIFAEGAIRHTAVITLAGNSITNDIAQIFKTPISCAEDIKCHYGCAYRELVPVDEYLEVPSVGGREPRHMARQMLTEIVEPRFQELLEYAYREIKQSGYHDKIAAGLVLTGGTAKMEGVVELAESVLDLQVRVGQPHGLKGLTDYVADPRFATAVGLLHYAKENIRSGTGVKKIDTDGLFEKIKTWFKGNF